MVPDSYRPLLSTLPICRGCYVQGADSVLTDNEKSKSVSPALKVPFLFCFFFSSDGLYSRSTQRVTLVLGKSVYTKTIEQHSDVSSPNSLLDVLWDGAQRLAKWISGRLSLVPSLLLFLLLLTQSLISGRAEGCWVVFA